MNVVISVLIGVATIIGLILALFAVARLLHWILEMIYQFYVLVDRIEAWIKSKL